MAEYITKDEVLLQLTGINLPKDRDSYIALVTKRLQDISAADVAPVIHAKWVKCDDGWGGIYYDCSYCGDSWTTIEGTPPDNGMNYCPHCGAKMDKEDKK